MSDLIDRDALLDEFDEDEPGEFSFVPLYELRNIIKELPAAGTIRHGRWERNKYRFFRCSECKKEAVWDENKNQVLSEYCPNCGAKMDEVAE